MLCVLYGQSKNEKFLFFPNRSSGKRLLYNRCIERNGTKDMDEKTKALIEKMKAGDQNAFDRIYRKEADKLYRIAYLISGNQSDSEDILQQSFVKCFLHRTEIHNPETFEKWITTILVRTAWKLLKKKGRAVSMDELRENEEQAGYLEQICEDRESPGPLEMVLQREERRRIYQAVMELEVKIRTVMILYYYRDYSVKEIAALTGSFEGMVKSRLYAGRKMLKGKLADGKLQKMEAGRVHG